MVNPRTPEHFLIGTLFLVVAVLFIHFGSPVAAILPGGMSVVYFGDCLRKLL